MSEFMKIKCNINSRGDIKSSNYWSRVFSFLDQRQKLKILIYNKQIQKMLGISIQDYIAISDRYKVVEKMEKDENIH